MLQGDAAPSCWGLQVLTVQCCSLRKSLYLDFQHEFKLPSGHLDHTACPEPAKPAWLCFRNLRLPSDNAYCDGECMSCIAAAIPGCASLAARCTPATSCSPSTWPVSAAWLCFRDYLNCCVWDDRLEKGGLARIGRSDGARLPLYIRPAIVPCLPLVCLDLIDLL